MIINTNVSAMNTHRQMGINQDQQQSAMEKLSSGLRINKAGDDAAGLAISEKMRGQINGLDQASRNAQDGISMIQTAEGALDESHSILQRMRELSVQSANDTNVDADREELQNEVNQLASELDRIAENTEFNTQKLLDGSMEGTFQIGANEGQNLDVKIDDMGASELGVSGSDGIEKEITASTDTIGGPADTGFAIEVSTGNSTAETELKAEELEETVTRGGENYNFALKNDDGNTVALSTDGGEYSFLDQEGNGEDVSSASIVSGASVNFGDANAKVTEGEVAVTTSDSGGDLSDIEAVASQGVVEVNEDAELASGSYKVVDDSHSQVDASGQDFGLVDSSGNVVGLSNDSGESFQSFSDSSQELFSTDTDNAFGAGDEVKIASDGGIDISSQENADSAISAIDSAIESVSSQRSEMGAVQNRLEHTISNLDNSSENLSAAESRIRDADMAAQMMEQTQASVKSQAAQSMLAQANQQPQSVLQLLG